jgi:hypothetical protein
VTGEAQPLAAPNRRLVLWRGAVGLIVAAALFLVWLTVASKDRSYVLNVESFGADITSAGLALSDWRLGPGTFVCARMPSPPPVQSILTSACDPGAFAVAQVSRSLEFGWDEGTRLLIGIAGAGDLTVDLAQVPDGGVDIGLVEKDFWPGSTKTSLKLQQFSRLIIPRPVLAMSGALPLSGRIVVGSVADAGSTRLLDSGRYAVRERLVGSASLTTIKEGELAFGDRVSFHAHASGRDATNAYGYLSANVSSDRGDSGPNPFRMVVSTAPGRGLLRIERLGTNPTEIEPTWTDRALRDPVVLGLTALLSLAGIVMTLAAESRALLIAEEVPPTTRQSSDGLNRSEDGMHRTESTTEAVRSGRVGTDPKAPAGSDAGPAGPERASLPNAPAPEIISEAGGGTGRTTPPPLAEKDA